MLKKLIDNQKSKMVCGNFRKIKKINMKIHVGNNVFDKLK